MSVAQTIAVFLTVDSGSYEAKMLGASKVTQDFEATTKTAGISVGRSFTAASGGAASLTRNIGGIAVAAYGIKKSIGVFTDLGEATFRLQQYTGGSAKEMSGLIYTSNNLGVSTAQLTTSMGLFSRSISQQRLQQFGIDIHDAHGNLLPFHDILANTADRIRGMSSAEERAAAVTTLFGRGGRALIPVLNEGGAGLDAMEAKASKLGVTLDQNGVTAYRNAAVAGRDFQQSVRGIGITFAEDLLPLGTGILRFFNAIPNAVKAPALELAVLSYAAAKFAKVWQATQAVMASKAAAGVSANTASITAPAGSSAANTYFAAADAAEEQAATALTAALDRLAVARENVARVETEGLAGTQLDTAAQIELAAATTGVEVAEVRAAMSGTELTVANKAAAGSTGLFAGAMEGAGTLIAGLNPLMLAAVATLYLWQQQAQHDSSVKATFKSDVEQGTTNDLQRLQAYADAKKKLLTDPKRDSTWSTIRYYAVSPDAGLQLTEGKGSRHRDDAARSKAAADAMKQYGAALLQTGTAAQIQKADEDGLLDTVVKHWRAATILTAELVAQRSATLGLNTEIGKARKAAAAGTATDNQLHILNRQTLKDADDKIAKQAALSKAIGQLKSDEQAYADNQKAIAGKSNEEIAAWAQAVDAAKADAKSVAQASQALVQANRGIETAVRGVGAAYRALDDAYVTRDEAIRTEQSAVRGVSDALFNQQQAIRGVHIAETQLNALEANSIKLTNDLATARQSAQRQLLADRNTALGDKYNVTAANFALQDAIAAQQRGPSPDDYANDPNAQAKLDLAVQQAKLQLVQAQQAQVQSTQDLNKANAAGVEGSQQVVSAQQAITQNNQAIADGQNAVIVAQRGEQAAGQAVSDAYHAVETAARGVSQAQQGIVDARQDIVDAQQAVTDAQVAAKQAADGLREAQAKQVKDQVNGYLAIKSMQDDAVKNSKALKDAVTADLGSIGQAANDAGLDLQHVFQMLSGLVTNAGPLSQALAPYLNMYAPDTVGGGGPHFHNATGGIHTLDAHVTRKPLMHYGEPSTGAEAYIPMHGGTRDKAIQTLKVAAGWYGMTVAALHSTGGAPADVSHLYSAPHAAQHTYNQFGALQGVHNLLVAHPEATPFWKLLKSESVAARQQWLHPSPMQSASSSNATTVMHVIVDNVENLGNKTLNATFPMVPTSTDNATRALDRAVSAMGQ